MRGIYSLTLVVNWLAVLPTLAGVLVSALCLGRSRWSRVLLGGFALRTAVSVAHPVAMSVIRKSTDAYSGAVWISSATALLGLLAGAAVLCGIAGLLRDHPRHQAAGRESGRARSRVEDELLQWPVLLGLLPPAGALAIAAGPALFVGLAGTVVSALWLGRSRWSWILLWAYALQTVAALVGSVATSATRQSTGAQSVGIWVLLASGLLSVLASGAVVYGIAGLLRDYPRRPVARPKAAQARSLDLRHGAVQWPTLLIHLTPTALLAAAVVAVVATRPLGVLPALAIVPDVLGNAATALFRTMPLALPLSGAVSILYGLVRHWSVPRSALACLLGVFQIALGICLIGAISTLLRMHLQD